MRASSSQNGPTSVPPLAQSSNVPLHVSSLLVYKFPHSPLLILTLHPKYSNKREKTSLQTSSFFLPPLMRGVENSSTNKIHHPRPHHRHQIYDGEPLCTTTLRLVSSVSGISLRHSSSAHSHFQPQRHLLLLLPLGQDPLPAPLFRR